MNRQSSRDHFADYELAVAPIAERALADSVRPKDLLADFSYFLESLNINPNVSELYSINERGRFTSTAIEQYVRIFLSMQEWDEIPRLDSLITSQLVHHLKVTSNASVYDSLSQGAQKFVLSPLRSANIWNPEVYLRTLADIGSHPDRVLKYDSFVTPRVEQRYTLKRRVDRVLEEIRDNAVSSEIIDRLDLTPSSVEFIEAIRARSAARLLMTSAHSAEMLTLWKVLFGEATVMEMLETFGSDRCELDQGDLMSLMEDWDNWKSYPSDWINEVYVEKSRQLSL